MIRHKHITYMMHNKRAHLGNAHTHNWAQPNVAEQVVVSITTQQRCLFCGKQFHNTGCPVQYRLLMYTQSEGSILLWLPCSKATSTISTSRTYYSTTASVTIIEMPIILYLKGISEKYRQTAAISLKYLYCLQRWQNAPKFTVQNQVIRNLILISIASTIFFVNVPESEKTLANSKKTPKYLKTVLSGKVPKCPTSVHGLTYRNGLWLHGPLSNCDVSC